MGTLVVVEVLGVRGRARLRRRLTALPATLGRALDCDVIVDDPQISSHHARIERDEEGVLVLVDLDSTNGTYRAGGGRLERDPVDGLRRYRLGNTILRIRSASEPVERTQISQSLSTPLVTLVQRRRVAVGLVATATAWNASSSFLTDFSPEPLGAVFSTSVTVLMILAVWAALWAVVSRMVTQRFRFYGHLASVALALMVVEIWDLGVRVGCYAFSVESATLALSLGGAVTAAAWLLYMHLRLSTFSPPRRLRWISAGLILAAAATVGIFANLDRATTSGDLRYPSDLWPPAFSFIAPQTAETFLDSAPSLAAEADAEISGR